VRLAHQFAMENELIKADCIESIEFPDLAQKYSVYAVPRTIINESAFIEGSMPENFFLERILETLGPCTGTSGAGQ
jgi:hypothetical protein